MRPTRYLLAGDARQLPLAPASVQCVVTSPPYWGLRDYGVAGQGGLEPTPELYLQQCHDRRRPTLAAELRRGHSMNGWDEFLAWVENARATMEDRWAPVALI